ncbi:MAG: hypothetical protein JW963_12610 [Anaerolineales bacterium]|nr:hypothetical protein [Anaerolineales bacterium]
MNNQSIPSESTIVNLLKNLSADKKPYPQGLLEARRVAYLSQVTLLAGSGLHLQKGNGRGQGGPSHAAAPMTPIMKVMLTALLAGNIALAAYLGVMVYENWDKVQALLFGAPIASETSPAPPELSTQPPAPDSTPEIATTPGSTDVPASTPEPGSPPEEPQPAEGNSVDNPEVSTPEPPVKDKPGLHLGQTPHSPDEPPGQDTNDDQGDDKDKDKDK